MNRLVSLDAGLSCLEENMIIDGAMGDDSLVDLNGHDMSHDLLEHGSAHSREQDEYGVERDVSVDDLDHEYSCPLIVEEPDEAFSMKAPLLTTAQRDNNKKRSSFLTPATRKSDKLFQFDPYRADGHNSDKGLEDEKYEDSEENESHLLQFKNDDDVSSIRSFQQ